MCQEFSVRYPCDATVPTQARVFATAAVHDALAGPGVDELAESVAVVLSELVTNAIQAGCSQVTVGLDVHRSHLRVAVTDDAPGWPRLLIADGQEVHGRGMAIVSSLAQIWGVQQLSAGKQVWAELIVTVALADGLACQL
jgi:two-component sensor histidine kinase